MPITPISTDQNKNTASIVSNMLNRGGRSLSQMLGQALQLGRNTADNQFRQEQSFLTEQRREIALNQRRAENTQQDSEDQQRLGEERRRFDLKFGQDDKQFDERTRQGELDRGIRQEQVDNSYELGKSGLDISRKNSDTSEFSAETSRMNAEEGLASLGFRKAEAQREQGNKVFTDEVEARRGKAQQQELQNYPKITDPQARQDAATKIASNPNYDASTRNRFWAEAGVGVTPEQRDAIGNLPRGEQAQVKGIENGLTALQELLTEGRMDPTTKKRVPLDAKEIEEVKAQMRAKTNEIQMKVSGAEQTANSLLDPLQ